MKSVDDISLSLGTEKKGCLPATVQKRANQTIVMP